MFLDLYVYIGLNFNKIILCAVEFYLSKSNFTCSPIVGGVEQKFFIIKSTHVFVFVINIQTLEFLLPVSQRLSWQHLLLLALFRVV